MMRRTLMAGATAAGVLGAGVAATGCESTQDKAAKLPKGNSDAFEQKGLRVTKQNPDVKVLSTTVVRGADNAAVVVQLRNASQGTLVRIPVAIDVSDASRRSVFRNDAAGLERPLVELAVLRAGDTGWWVNDQIPVSSEPTMAMARIGAGRRAPAQPPRLRVQGATLGSDGALATATGFVRNDSMVEQRELVIYAVARRAGRVVAAGRGQIDVLGPQSRQPFTIYFAGDPRGAKLDLDAPATVLKGGSGGAG